MSCRSNLELPSWYEQIAHVEQLMQARLEESERCSSRIGSGSDFLRIGKLVRQYHKNFPRSGFSGASLDGFCFGFELVSYDPYISTHEAVTHQILDQST